MRDLDEYLGDLHGFILDREVELVQEMLEKIMKHAGTFEDVSNIIAEMDVLLAFADASRQCENSHVCCCVHADIDLQSDGLDLSCPKATSAGKQLSHSLNKGLLTIFSDFKNRRWPSPSRRDGCR